MRIVRNLIGERGRRGGGERRGSSEGRGGE